MKNNFLPLAIGIILAVAAVFMLRNYLDEQKKAVIAQAGETARNLQANQVVVLVARKPIPAGVMIEPNMIDTTVAYRNEVSSEAARSYAEIQDKASTRAITAGEIIVSSALRSTPKQNVLTSSTGAFSNQIPDGKRAVPLQVSNIADIVEKIKPGDHVDVIAIVPLPAQGQQAQTINIPIFQDIQVLAVGDAYGQSKSDEAVSGIKKMVEEKVKGGQKKPASTGDSVTVALDLDEANVIAFVQGHGEVKLMMRSPTDTGVVNYQERLMDQQSTQAIMNYDAFFQYLIMRGLMPPPRQPSPQEVEAAQPKKGKQVEIYRGDKKEVKERIQ
jgi:Flp pilus assembly protein CpaB